jgi:cytochrome c-type biogenesis protein CcmF
MLPELGLFALILACSLTIVAIAIYKTADKGLSLVPVALAQNFFLIIATIVLLYSFMLDDFSVKYIANNSHSSLSLIYKFAALWGGHEGSFLLLILIMSFWVTAATFYLKNSDLKFTNTTLLISISIIAFFVINIIFTANPFARLFPNTPLDGADLNPLLQDMGMTIHPPILFCGYVGNIVAFSLTCAGLIHKRNDLAYINLIKTFVVATWGILSVGIALGSWWAYYELGWGGWWFWDPVENASFMPWLINIAAIHILILAKRNARFLKIAQLLVVMSFAISIFGIFLVRSSIISSVHTFAADPKRALFLLVLLLIIVPFALYWLIKTNFTKHMIKKKISKLDAFLLANAAFLILAMLVVFLGTVYPLFDSKVSVGFPYYNAVFLPIMSGLMLTLLIAIPPFHQIKYFGINILASSLLAYGVLKLVFMLVNLYAWLGMTLGIAIIISTVCSKFSNKMKLAHIGFAVVVIGVSVTPIYEIEKDVRLKVGEHVILKNYRITFDHIHKEVRDNHIAYRGAFSVEKDGMHIVTLKPEKRVFVAREIATAETALWPGLLKDLSISLSNQLDENTWAVRMYYKPFVRFIWLGAFIMALAVFSWRTCRD